MDRTDRLDLMAQAVQLYGPKAYAVAALLDKKRWSLESLRPGPQHTISLENIQSLFHEALDDLKRDRNKDAYFNAKGVADTYASREPKKPDSRNLERSDGPTGQTDPRTRRGLKRPHEVSEDLF
jgi:hypothetical protein